MADPLMDDIDLQTAQRQRVASEGAAVPLAGAEKADLREERYRSQRIQTGALVILATAAVLSLMYIAKLILVVVLASVLIAFVLAPVVDALTNLQVPRPFAAFLAVFLLLIMVATVAYLSYARALDFLSQMPEYRIRVQHILYE